MEIMDRVQPKPGIARPKKERKGERGGRRDERKEKGRKEKAQMFEAKVKIAACPI